MSPPGGLIGSHGLAPVGPSPLVWFKSSEGGEGRRGERCSVCGWQGLCLGDAGEIVVPCSLIVVRRRRDIRLATGVKAMNFKTWRTCPSLFLLATIVGGSLLAPTHAAAQLPAPHRTAFWVAAAVGPTTPYQLGIVATAALRSSRLILSARYASAGEFAGDWFEDVGIVLSAVVTPSSRRAQLALAAGIGRAHCRHCGFLVTQPKLPSSTGFLMNAEARLALTPFFGATAYVFGDLNSSRSFGGVAVGLFVGRL